MPTYDVTCRAGHDSEVFTNIEDRACPCPTCGASTERVWRHRAAAVNGDACDFYDPHLERRFTSKAEHDRVIKSLGYVRKVRHVPGRSGDRSTLTQRWDVCPAALLVSEADRLARSAEWDRLHGITRTPRDVALVVPEPPPQFSAAEYAALRAVAAQVGL